MSEVPVGPRRAAGSFLGPVACGLVAFSFHWAAIEKVAGPEAFAKSIRDYGVLPTSWTNVAAFIVPWVEIVASILLIFGGWRAEARRVIALLLLLFIGLKVSALARGLTIGCGCVSEDSILAPLFRGAWGIVTNVVLLAFLAFDFYCAKRLRPARPHTA